MEFGCSRYLLEPNFPSAEVLKYSQRFSSYYHLSFWSLRGFRKYFFHKSNAFSFFLIFVLSCFIAEMAFKHLDESIYRIVLVDCCIQIIILFDMTAFTCMINENDADCFYCLILYCMSFHIISYYSFTNCLSQYSVIF